MSTEHSDNIKAADTIANTLYAAAQDLCVAMPNGIEPYDYSLEYKQIRSELSDICVQLERIANHLEGGGSK